MDLERFSGFETSARREEYNMALPLLRLKLLYVSHLAAGVVGLGEATVYGH
jgi:hypothetical protein